MEASIKCVSLMLFANEASMLSTLVVNRRSVLLVRVACFDNALWPVRN